MAQHINGPLNYERLGREGPIIAWVHPNPMDYNCWIYQMAHFSTWFRCIGIDIPGYGRSPAGEPGLNMVDVAAACWEAVEDAFPGERAVIAGLSVGSHIVQHMAVQQPERTRAVILSGTGYRPDRDFTSSIENYNARGVAYRYEFALNDFSPAFRETPIAHYFARLFSERNQWADVPTINAMFASRKGPDPDGFHASITMPAVVITGSEDGAHAGAFTLQSLIPGCELVTIEGAGHCCNMEKPWEWDAIALRFLEKHGLFSGQAAALTAQAASD